MSNRDKNVDWKMASNIPGMLELTSSVIGKIGSLYKTKNGKSNDIHLCSIDQSGAGNFRKE